MFDFYLCHPVQLLILNLIVPVAWMLVSLLVFPNFFLTKTTSTAFGATNNRQRDCNIDTTHAAEVAVFVEKLIKMSAASYDSVGHIAHYRFGSLVQHLLWTRFTDCTCVYIHTVHLLRQRRRDRVPFVVLFCHELGVDSSVLAIATCSLLDDMYCGVLSIIC